MTQNATGTPVPHVDLAALGFVRHDLRFRPSPDPMLSEWDTLGDIPDAPGLYVFVLEHPDWTDKPRVAYVGRTAHLWMVTKGSLPRSGGARGGNHYGRPKHAGMTRVRINAEVTEAMANGCAVTHWLSPRQNVCALPIEEEQLITTWRLRARGWNRG